MILRNLEHESQKALCDVTVKAKELKEIANVQCMFHVLS